MSSWRRTFRTYWDWRRFYLEKAAADLRSLPLRQLSRNAWSVIALLFIIPVLALALNPLRTAALQCLAAILVPGVQVTFVRLIPSTPSGVVPVELARLVLRLLMLGGIARIGFGLLAGLSLRLCLYAATVLLALALNVAIAWITVLEGLTARRWEHDGLQGTALLLAGFALTSLLYRAARWWWVDVERRCPVCLRLPGMPEHRGRATDVLIDPFETESICFYGHGLMREDRWSRRFAAGGPLFPQ